MNYLGFYKILIEALKCVIGNRKYLYKSHTSAILALIFFATISSLVSNDLSLNMSKLITTKKGVAASVTTKTKWPDFLLTTTDVN